MPPPPHANREIHQTIADLYGDKQLVTTDSHNRLVELVAKRLTGYRGPTDDATMLYKRESVAKVLARAYKGTDRNARVWQAVLDRTNLPADDPDHVTLSVEGRKHLTLELETADPLFTPVRVLLADARNAPTPAARLETLNSASELLLSLTPDAPDPDKTTPAGDARRTMLQRVGYMWARLFEVAVGDTGQLGDDEFRYAQDCVRHAVAVQRRGDALRVRPVFAFRGARWAPAVAVLSALRDASAEQMVQSVRDFVTTELGGTADSVIAAEILTQAGITLLSAGRRQLASTVTTAAWQHALTDNSGRVGGGVPDELLELSIELAGVHYAHGDMDAARAALHSDLRAILASDPGGDPDGIGWGEVVSNVFYSLLCQVLDDPAAGIGEMRLLWIETLGDVWSTGYPSKWALAGLLAGALAHAGQGPAAATVAQMSVRLLDEPRTPNEQQLRAHLSEMFTVSRPTASAPSRGLAAQLLADTVALAVAEPDAFSFSDRLVLDGLVRLLGGYQRRGRRLRHLEPDLTASDTDAA